MAILKVGKVLSTIQINNCYSLMNDETFIELQNCNGTFIIKGENIIYVENDCDVEAEGKFTASFELVCN